MNTFKKLSEKIYNVNAKNGFWDDRINIPSKLKAGEPLNEEEIAHVEEALRNQAAILVITELAEMVDASRKVGVDYESKINEYKKYLEESGKDFDKDMFAKLVKDTPQDEFADTQIRMLDYNHGYNQDLDWHVDQKLKYNAQRKPKHGKKY